MNLVQCGHCASTNITVVSSDEARGVVIVRCFDCTQVSEVDAEGFHVDTGDLPQE